MADRPMIVEHHPFVKALARSLRHHCHITPQSRILLAVSGGADSVALLHALNTLKNRRRWQLHLTVAHIQHHIRTEAESDARFVEQLAATCNLPYLRKDIDLSTSQGNTENLARTARYAALQSLADQSNSQFVATAHHGDDQLETILMRLLRGSSVPGLAAMAYRRRLSPDSNIRLIRPLLSVDRTQIITFLNDINQPWVEDHTNKDVSRLRARLRRDVLPILHDITPHAAKRAVTLAEDARNLRDVLDHALTHAAADLITTQQPNLITLDRPKSRDLPKIILGQLLRQQLTTLGANEDTLGKKTINPILKAIRDTKGGQRKFQLSFNIHITITRHQITLSVGPAVPDTDSPTG